MDIGLKGRVAIVAGASSGIGRATALAFAAEGAHLALCARRQDKLDELAEELRRAHGADAYTAQLDVTDDAGVHRFAGEVHRHFGRIDVCVPNAGGPPAKPFIETSLDEWDSAYRANLRSVVSFAQAVLPHMRERRWGRLVAITSVTVKQPVDNLVLSNAIRTGVAGLVRTLANEYGPDGITVNNVGPGYTATERLKELAAQRQSESGASETEFMTGLARNVALRRVAEPAEVADAIVWLSSERASYITGQTLLVDGGAYRGL